LVTEIPTGDGKIANLFYSVGMNTRKEKFIYMQAETE